MLRSCMYRKRKVLPSTNATGLDVERKISLSTGKAPINHERWARGDKEVMHGRWQTAIMNKYSANLVFA